MKQRHFLALALCWATGTAMSQTVASSALPSLPGSRTDQFFRRAIGNGNKSFTFLLPAGNRVVIELSELRQIDSLPPLDSLVTVCWRQLQAISDSLQSPLESRRIDLVFISPEDVRIRWQRFPQQDEVYRVKESEVTQVKVEQDTLCIRLYTRRGTTASGSPYSVSFVVNHLTDVPGLAASPGLAAAVQQLRNDLAVLKKKRSGSLSFSRYQAVYDAQEGNRISPGGTALRGVGSRNEWLPYVQVGIQFLRGAWLPSAGVGLELTQRFGTTYENRYQLVWEPHFIMNGDAAKPGRLLRNDFVTFRIRQSSAFKTGGREFNFVQNFSAGYMVHRSGEFFRRSTFKFTVPGLQFKNILLEPEGFFNNLFRNFSPSLKLTLYLE